MNAAFHSDPHSVLMDDDGEALPEFWGADLALRIWLWISQICFLSLPHYQSHLKVNLLATTIFFSPQTPYKLALMAASQGADAESCKPKNCKPKSCSAKAMDETSCRNGTCQRMMCEACEFHAANRVPARHERHMQARRARGIMPASRYPTFFLRPLLRKGLRAGQLLEALIRISGMGRLRAYNWHYHTGEFFKGRAMKTRAAIGSLRAQVVRLCHAPLSPD